MQPHHILYKNIFFKLFADKTHHFKPDTLPEISGIGDNVTGPD